METGKIQKYTAYAFVKKEQCCFYKINGLYFIKINEKIYSYNYNPENPNNKPDEENLGIIYKVDSDFEKELKKFTNNNSDWKIIFYPDKKDGCVCYCSLNKNDTPSEIISLVDKKIKLVLESDDKYDLICG